jgi:PAS domain S-box-containing protein
MSMFTRSRLPQAGNLLLIAAALLIAGVAPYAVAAETTATGKDGKPSRILYINSYNRGYAWSDAIETGLTEQLNASGRTIDISVEYLDSRRFPDRGYESALADALQLKYRNFRHDLVVVSDNNAFAFAMRYRERLFPGRPIVFCGYNSFRPEALKGISDVTGVNEEVDFPGTIDLALSVHPATDTLAFIVSSGTPSGARNLTVAEEIVLPAYARRYKIVLLKDLTAAAIKERLAGLSGSSLVFIVGEASDYVSESSASQKDFARQIASASPVPVYSFWDFYLDSGVLGGHVITGLDQGRAAAALTLKILTGTRVSDLPVVMKTPTSTIFDFNAMQRFGLSDAALPPGSSVINKPDTFYEKYRNYVWIGTAVLFLLCIVVLVLALLLRQSRRLEAQVRASESRFRVLVEQAPEAIIVYDADAERIVDANANALRLFGYPREELLQLTPEQLYSPHQPDGTQVLSSIREHVDRVMSGEQLVFERIIRNASAEEIHCEVRTVRLPSDHARLIRVSIIDISLRKRAEEALRQRQAQIESIFRGAPVGMAEVRDRKIVLANKRLCDMFGYSPEELIDQSTGILFSSNAEWERTRSDGFAQVSDKAYAIIETALRRKDGSAIEVLFGFAPIVPDEPTAFFGTVIDITERNAATRALKHAFAELRLLSSRLLNAQEDERRTIANELHDEIGQALTAVNLKLHMLGKQVAKGTASAADVESCMEIADLALTQVRNLSVDLRPPQLDLMGLEAALQWLLHSRADASALDTHLIAQLAAQGRNPQIDITCFRIVQEALSNVIKHAHARHLWVSAKQAGDVLELQIEDDGTGFNYDEAKAKASRGTSVGLLSMQERVELMGGSFSLVSRLGGGTTIRALIPLAPEDPPVPSRSVSAE